MFTIPDMSMGAESRGGVDGTAMAAEKTGLTWPLDRSGGRLLSSQATPRAQVLRECREASGGLVTDASELTRHLYLKGEVSKGSWGRAN